MAKTAKAKTKVENQIIVGGDCRQAINWYTNMLAEDLQAGNRCSRGLLATNFEADDQLLLDTALSNLESKGFKPLIINGSDLYKQADYLWEISLSQTKFGRPTITAFEEGMRNSQLLVLKNLDTPLSPQQLWYLYHHVLYPAALVEKPLLISTPLSFEEFVMYGAGCEDFEYAGRRITWEKVVSVLNATVMNLYHCKQLQQENLPAMLLPEYRFYRSLQERHLGVSPHHNAHDYLLDFAVIDETAKIKLNIECDFIHRFGLMLKTSVGLLGEQTKRDKTLISAGWQILRFSAKELAGSPDSCADAVEELLRNNSKKSSVGRCINLPMLSVNQQLPAQDNDEQAAILHSAGPAAIIGGAGTGKSMCIAYRLSFLLGQGVSPERILVLSYSNETLKPLKLAAEKIMLGSLSDKVNFSTWHDLGFRILKENVLTIKRKLPLKVDTNPQKILPKLITKYIKEADLTALEILGYPDEHTISSTISSFKANLISIQAARENAKNERDLLIAKVYAGYEEQLQKTNKIDRDDMVSLAAQILGQEVELRNRYENLFEHIIIDEHQDATVAADFLTRVLACPNDNIIFVGNPDEAIYQVEKSAPQLLAETSLRTPNAGCYLLNHNWRAHPEITKHAEQYIKLSSAVTSDKSYIEKNTITGWGNVLTQAVLGPFQFKDDKIQTNWIIERIDELLVQGRKPEEIAILCKSKEQMTAFEAVLVPQGLVISTNESDANLLPDEESDVITFLKLVADPDGPKAREYFERVCQLKFKGINPKLSSTITDVAESFNVSYLKAVEFYAEAAADPFSTQLEQLVKRIRSMHRDKLSPYEVINLLKRPQWLGDYYKSIKLPPRVVYEPMKMMSQIQDQARTHKTVSDFLKSYSPAKMSLEQLSSGQASLNLITVKESKGREFQVVFVPDLVEGIYPETENQNVGDEERMFYVALTRARELLFLSCPKEINAKEYLPSEYLRKAGLTVSFVEYDEKVVKIKKTEAIEEENVIEDKTVVEGGVMAEPPAIIQEEIVLEPIICKEGEKAENILVEETILIPEVASASIAPMEKAVVVNEETAPTIIEAEILPDVIIEELPIQPAPVQPKSIQTASVQQTPIQQVPVQPTPIQQTPKPKTTNLFGLIREKNSAEIVDEFSAPNSNENKVNLGEIVRQARETQLAQPLDPGSLDQQPVPVPFAVNRADLIDTAKIETPIIMPTLPEKKNTIKCIHCQTILEVGARFCGECGAGQSTQTKSACKSCGIPIDPSEKFCGECGSSQ